MAGHGPADGQATDVAAGWQAAGTDEVMLPTGTTVRVLLPGAGAMARLGVTPGVLRGIVSRLTGDTAQGRMSDEDWAQWRSAIRQLIAESVVAVKLPGADAFTEHTIGVDDRLPPVDEDSLVALVMRFDSPAQVDARSRAVLAGEPSAAAAAAWARTAHATLPAWESFIESDEGLLCALSARTWRVRPSSLLGITDPVVAYSVDEALMLRLTLRTSRPRGERVEHDPAIAAEVADWHEQRLREEGRLTH